MYIRKVKETLSLKKAENDLLQIADGRAGPPKKFGNLAHVKGGFLYMWVLGSDPTAMSKKRSLARWKSSPAVANQNFDSKNFDSGNSAKKIAELEEKIKNLEAKHRVEIAELRRIYEEKIEKLEKSVRKSAESSVDKKIDA